MGAVEQYKGIANQDLRSLRGGNQAPREGARIISVEDLRRGATFEVPEEAEAPKGVPQEGAADAEKAAGSPTLAPYRGRRGDTLGKTIPDSYLAAHSDRGLTEEQKIAKLTKIRDSAKEYEGMLMAEMIKSMRQTPMAKTPGSDTYSEIAEKPFTAALTAAGGLGLADRIVEDVARQEGLLGTLAEHPEVMGPNWNPRISPSKMYKPANTGDVRAQPYRRAPDRTPASQADAATLAEADAAEGLPIAQASRIAEDATQPAGPAQTGATGLPAQSPPPPYAFDGFRDGTYGD
ncbi:MAG: hypothetical protein LBF40_09995, partial [Deltaproteobacteria bacterium]|nr:hypothetical protein [Deltaproteobacteria bacterium]